MHRVVKWERCVSLISSGAQLDPKLTRNMNYRYLPVMIIRLMISLKKAGNVQGSAWSMGEHTTNRCSSRESHSMRFARNHAVQNTREDYSVISPSSPPGV